MVLPAGRETSQQRRNQRHQPVDDGTVNFLAERCIRQRHRVAVAGLALDQAPYPQLMACRADVEDRRLRLSVHIRCALYAVFDDVRAERRFRMAGDVHFIHLDYSVTRTVRGTVLSQRSVHPGEMLACNQATNDDCADLSYRRRHTRELQKHAHTHSRR